MNEKNGLGSDAEKWDEVEEPRRQSWVGELGSAQDSWQTRFKDNSLLLIKTCYIENQDPHYEDDAKGSEKR